MQHANCQTTVIHKAYNTALTNSVQISSDFTGKIPDTEFLNLVLPFRYTDYSDHLPLLCFSTTAKIRGIQSLARYTYCFCTCVISDNITTNWLQSLSASLQVSFFSGCHFHRNGTRLFNTVQRPRFPSTTSFAKTSYT